MRRMKVRSGPRDKTSWLIPSCQRSLASTQTEGCTDLQILGRVEQLTHPACSREGQSLNRSCSKRSRDLGVVLVVILESMRLSAQTGVSAARAEGLLSHSQVCATYFQRRAHGAYLNLTSAEPLARSCCRGLGPRWGQSSSKRPPRALAVAGRVCFWHSNLNIMST